MELGGPGRGGAGICKLERERETVASVYQKLLYYIYENTNLLNVRWLPRIDDQGASKPLHWPRYSMQNNYGESLTPLLLNFLLADDHYQVQSGGAVHNLTTGTGSYEKALPATKKRLNVSYTRNRR